MKFFIDLHTHTAMSGHVATESVEDMAYAASQKGLEYLAITDHSPSCVGSAPDSYFMQLQTLPKELFGVKMLYGCEIDILDTEGSLGLCNEALPMLDVAIVSLHTMTFEPRDKQQNTDAYISAISRGIVDIVGHSDDSRYEIDYERLIKVCKQYGTAMEINNSSLEQGSCRTNARPNDLTILQLCKKYDCPVSFGSDAHGIGWLLNYRHILPLVEQTDFPERLILNCNKTLLWETLAKHKANRQKFAK